MNRIFGLFMWAVGIALVIYGLNLSHWATTTLSRTFTGSPADKTLWLVLGGIASSVFGAVLAFMPSRG